MIMALFLTLEFKSPLDNGDQTPPVTVYIQA
jgi:hypothetical protein